METWKNYSYKRRVKLILSALFTITLLFYGYTMYQEYRERVLYTVYLESDKPILDGRTSQIFTSREQYEEECKYVYDETMYEDEVVVTEEGSSGVRETITLTEFYNGNEIETKVLEETIIEKAVPREIHIGTKKRPEYIMPVSGYVLTSEFGPRWGRNHNGIDLAVATGTPIQSSTDGVVVRAEWFSGYGLCVDVDHGNGVLVRYGHLSRIDVSVGQTVSQWDQLGLSGNTGNSTGPHLHFEVEIDGVPVNPLDYVTE